MSDPAQGEIAEIKSYFKSVLHAYVVAEQMGNCKKCGKWKDLREGVCFDCAVPACVRTECPFRRLVYYNQGRKQIWADMTYVGLHGKVYCNRDEGVCSDMEYAVELDKQHHSTNIKWERRAEK